MRPLGDQKRFHFGLKLGIIQTITLDPVNPIIYQYHHSIFENKIVKIDPNLASLQNLPTVNSFMFFFLIIVVEKHQINKLLKF